MSIEKVNAALVKAYQDLGQALPTYYEARDAAIGAVDTKSRFAEVYNIPSDRRPVTLGSGGEDEVVGIFQINYGVPENTGTAELHRMADVATKFFIAGRHLVYQGQVVNIERSWPSSIRKSSTRAANVISVSVRWNARVVRDPL